MPHNIGGESFEQTPKLLYTSEVYSSVGDGLLHLLLPAHPAVPAAVPAFSTDIMRSTTTYLLIQPLRFFPQPLRDIRLRLVT